MNDENKEPELNELGSKQKDNELDKLIEPFKEQNPEMTEEEAEELKKAIKSLMEANKKHLKKVEYIKKFFKSLTIYLLSTLSLLGFFFSFIALENKWLSLIIPAGLTVVLTIYEMIKFIQFVKKPIIFSLKPYFFEIGIMCLTGFLVNEFIKIFEYSIIFSIYIVLTIVMKILITSTIDKVIRKKVVVERRDKDV
jgi:hypothetical protein